MGEYGRSLTTKEVLTRYRNGPQTGVFTDGGARPNPGPGGWGLVWVQDGRIIKELFGHDEATTNNRMELTALIEAYKMLDDNAEINVFSDSDLCVKTINEWASQWARKGWKRKTGPIKNLELVQELYALQQRKPGLKLQWIKAHNGWLWNEYVDALSSAWTREEV